MDEEGGRPGAGTRHATPPPAGAAAVGRSRTIVPYAVPPNGATLNDSNTGLDGGQDNGESIDVAQQHGTTSGTASAVFHRLGYVMAGETNTTRQPAPTTNNTGLDGGQDNGESSDAAQQHGTTPGTASAQTPRSGSLQRSGNLTDITTDITRKMRGRWTLSALALGYSVGFAISM